MGIKFLQRPCVANGGTVVERQRKKIKTAVCNLNKMEIFLTMSRIVNALLSDLICE